jgi:3',5'-cyclic AMP phosphodiesterase CpdA
MLVQLSDLHIRVGPDDEGSGDAAAAAVAAVLRLDPLPEAVLVSGDVANDGLDAEYARAKELLAPLPMPVHVLGGNHDDRERLEAAFGTAAAFDVRVGALRLIGCHTPIAGRPEGRLDLDWLADRLSQDGDLPTIVAMHHPPLPIGLSALDAIGLAEAERAGLAGLLERSPQVRRVVAGHVHRTSFGTLGGCQVVTCASTHLAARLELTADDFRMAPEPPAFLVHVLLDGDVLTHVQPVT